MPSVSRKIDASPAGILTRAGALVYDLLLLIAVWMTTLLVAVVANQGESVSAWWVPLLLYIEAFAYYFYSWQKSGQTLGMRTWRLKVVNSDGGGIGSKAVVIRLLIAPISFAAFGLGYLAFYFGDRQQTWHDRLSQSYVVRLPKEQTS